MKEGKTERRKQSKKAINVDLYKIRMYCYKDIQPYK